MKNVVENKAVHYALVVFSIAFGLYAFFYHSPSSQALSNAPIGYIQGTMVPDPVLAGTESFTVAYESYSGVGDLDISGWSVSDGAGFSYSFTDGTVLNHGDSLKVCADKAVENCPLEWLEGDELVDSDGDFILKDNTGKTVFSVGYGILSGGADVAGTYELNVAVYAKNDKIVICQENNKGVLSSKGQPVGPFIKSIESGNKSHAVGVNDIVPSFYYNVGLGVEFYHGNNWPDLKDAYDAGC